MENDMLNTNRFDFFPAIANTQGPDPLVSHRYRFMPTTEILDALESKGFQIVSASQGHSTSPFAKHRIYMDHADFTPFEVAPGDTARLRVALFNSHNRRGRFQLHVGSFRDVCENTCVFGAHAATSLIFRHQGNPLGDDFIEGVYRVIDDSKSTLTTMRDMAKVPMTEAQQFEFASRAVELRWKGTSPVEISDVIRPRRTADVGSNLWLTYQRTQESLIRGGMQGRTTTNKLRTIKALRSIDKDMKVNAELWNLATEYLENA
jgi:hypothetical protein